MYVKQQRRKYLYLKIFLCIFCVISNIFHSNILPKWNGIHTTTWDTRVFTNIKFNWNHELKKIALHYSQKSKFSGAALCVIPTIWYDIVELLLKSPVLYVANSILSTWVLQQLYLFTTNLNKNKLYILIKHNNFYTNVDFIQWK